MNKTRHKTLIPNVEYDIEIENDGHSMDFVTFRFYNYIEWNKTYRVLSTPSILIGKEQLEELVRDLQRMLTEL